MSEALTGLEHFKALFNRLGSQHLEGLEQVYHENALFQDPFVRVEGLQSLTAYFTGAYSNVIQCRFDYGKPVVDGDRIVLPWVMHLQHRKLRSGQSLQVDGISHLQFAGQRVTHHRDYFDAGQLLYENIPLLGAAVRWLKRYAA
ncbi:MAG: nuclear transport factor 2 family protein [Oleiphilaceae bacterium]|nr:nuclear transport factor 2 family protein [Oleiphilaceae bacterium]